MTNFKKLAHVIRQCKYHIVWNQKPPVERLCHNTGTRQKLENASKSSSYFRFNVSQKRICFSTLQVFLKLDNHENFHLAS